MILLHQVAVVEGQLGSNKIQQLADRLTKHEDSTSMELERLNRTIQRHVAAFSGLGSIENRVRSNSSVAPQWD